MHLFIVAFACLCFGSFAWAINGFFVCRGGVQRRMKVLQSVGLVSVLMHLVAIGFMFPGHSDRTFVSVCLYAGALGMFWWSVSTVRAQPLSLAFSLDAPGHLVTSGPYRWVRHPFYTSYLLAWLAGYVATAAWWLIPSIAVMSWFYVVAARHEEAKFASGPLATRYAQYMTTSGMFWPRLKCAAPLFNVLGRR